MKLATVLILALLSASASAGDTKTFTYNCSSTSGKCPAPPIPPVPPVPPVPPAPPAPPPLPDIPDAAHAACAGKSAGASVSYVIRKGETITGTCGTENGKPRLQLRSWTVTD